VFTNPGRPDTEESHVKLTSFLHHGAPGWGIVDGDSVAPVAAYPDLRAAIAADALAALTPGPRLKLSTLQLLPVIPNPARIICIGINYVAHRQETGRPEVAHPTIFLRFPSSQTGHNTALVRPKVTENLDYEGELAVIIGKPGRYIAEHDAMHHIAGYACYNDASVRDWQRHTSQFIPGKNFPATGGFGPWMVTPDEVPDLPTRRLQTRLNGDIVQEAPLRDMIFNIAQLIAYCSSFTPLEPGDVIVTGTPGGVGERRTPPLWLQPGDVVEVEIDGIGILRNSVEQED
jgi:2-keto-4-pentenoate hydratase/2-oxohepta-3-ene-1,7-dioic acid hydratase in catechol pathway